MSEPSHQVQQLPAGPAEGSRDIEDGQLIESAGVVASLITATAAAFVLFKPPHFNVRSIGNVF